MKQYRFLIYLLGLPLLFVLLYFVGVIGYAWVTDYQPEATESVALYASAEPRPIPDTLTLLSWNIGYAGLGAESDFFYDGGSTVRMPRPVVDKNLRGILSKLGSLHDSIDFFLLQEVDRDAKRSYAQDQFARVMEQFPGFSAAYASNYRVQFVPVPFGEPMGKVEAGVAAYARFLPTASIRHAFQSKFDWPTYLFFLDRCFLVQRFDAGQGKELLVINTHNSAYDDGSLKAVEMEQLKTVLQEEFAKGNFVIVGGDWNQFPANFRGLPGFEQEKTEANARFFVEENYPQAGWTWAWDPAAPTNRELKAAFLPETTPRAILDFFLLSPNVELVDIHTHDMGFAYSDHQPVQLRVRLQR